MGRVLFVLLLFLPGAVEAQAQGGASPAPNTADLLGTWRVDLRPTLDAAPAYTDFVISAVEGSSFAGTFYNSPIENGRIDVGKGTLWFAFTTSDGSTNYNTAGKLVDGALEGSTHAIGREFLRPWTAERKP